MKTNTPAPSQPLQQQSSRQIHFAQQNSGFQVGTNLCESCSDSGSPLGHWGAALHHFWLLRTRDSCSILPFPWSASEWEEKTSPSFLSTSIQQWRTNLSLSGGVNTLWFRGVFSACRDAQQCSEWLCLIMVTKAPHPAKAALKPALHTGLGGRGSAGGSRSLPKSHLESAVPSVQGKRVSCYSWLSGMLPL